MRKSFLAAIALLAVTAVPSFTGDTNFGLGFFTKAAPVGGRVWVSKDVAVDAGLGFTSVTPDGGKSTTQFILDLGLPYVVKSSDKAKFFVRPGFTFYSLSNNGASISNMALNADLGVEYFMADNFSIEVSHGLSYLTGDTGAIVKGTTISTRGFGSNDLGFHYYFGGK